MTLTPEEETRIRHDLSHNEHAMWLGFAGKLSRARIADLLAALDQARDDNQRLREAGDKLAVSLRMALRSDAPGVLISPPLCLADWKDAKAAEGETA